MISSENAGVISKCPGYKNAFKWKIPNYYAYQFCLPIIQPTPIDRMISSQPIGNPGQLAETPRTGTTQIQDVNPRLVSSPCFSAFNSKWRLALVLNAERASREYVAFFLWMVASSIERPHINVKLVLLNCDGNEYKKCEGEVDLTGCFGSWNFDYLNSFSKDKHRISPSGILQFVCKMEVKDPIIFVIPKSPDCLGKEEEKNENVTSEEVVENGMPEVKGVDRLAQNLKTLMLDEHSSDVVLKVEDREFKAHKNILKVRSPVFASMFQPHTEESATGVVDIPDYSESAFAAFLLYIYTGSSEVISSDNVCDLYYAAHEYEMDDLKSECAEFMEHNLSVENFCDIMTLCFLRSEPSLHKTATLFFCENVKIIIKTAEWQNLMKGFTIEANELFIKSTNA